MDMSENSGENAVPRAAVGLQAGNAFPTWTDQDGDAARIEARTRSDQIFGCGQHPGVYTRSFDQSAKIRFIANNRSFDLAPTFCPDE
jgi:hypothetical protein